MECGWFCVLCGAPLDLTGEAHTLDPDDERYRVGTIRVQVPAHWSADKSSGCTIIGFWETSRTLLFTVSPETLGQT
jgi:hypothetical protein